MRNGAILAFALAMTMAGCGGAKSDETASTPGVVAPVPDQPATQEVQWADIARLTRTSLNGAPSTREPAILQSVSSEPRPEWATLDLWKFRLLDTETGAELVLTQARSPGTHALDARDVKSSGGVSLADGLETYGALPVYELTGAGKAFAPRCDGDVDHVVVDRPDHSLDLNLYFFKGTPDGGPVTTCGPAWFQIDPCDGPPEVLKALKDQGVFDKMCVNNKADAPGVPG